MIRPLTIATFLMACGSGLYLYQSKHEAQVLDRTIEKTVHETAALREQSRLLATEWTMLNDPETLRKFADSYLQVKPIDPKQFASLADLDSRLPAVQQPAPASTGGTDEDAPLPVSEATPVAPIPLAAPVQPEVATAVSVTQPLSSPRRAVAAAAPARAIERKVVTAHPASTEAVTYLRPTASPEARPPEQRMNEFRPAETHLAEPRPVRPPEQQLADARAAEQRAYDARAAELRRQLAAAPTVLASAPRQAAYPPAAPAPYSSGSLLGMAHGAAPPVPRPTPVTSTQWSTAN
jgi:hypothetical protein